MTPTRIRNPFKPGRGATPPYLAGRENEQNRLREILADMADGDSPAADIVMYGPRGMGKTVLLNWFANEAKKGGTKDNSIRVSRVTPDQLTSPADMWGFLISKNWLQKKFPNKKEAGVKGFLYGVWTENSTPPKKLLDKLIRQCKKSPLVCLLDEAHTMEPGQCRALLNLSQEVQNEAPFLLVLAGTPGLEHFLTTVGASFVERSNKIGIGRLDAQATADAIVKPLNEHGIKIDDNSLAPVVEDSQHYPYFIQLWGEALWDLAKEKELEKLTAQEVTIAKTKVDGVRLHFYGERKDKLDDLELLPAAIAIAKVFQDTETTTRDRLKGIIADNLPVDSLTTQSVNEHLQTFVRHDFIWKPPQIDLYEPGIPSLMAYVLDQQREHVQKVPPASPA